MSADQAIRGALRAMPAWSDAEIRELIAAAKLVLKERAKERRAAARATEAERFQLRTRAAHKAMSGMGRPRHVVRGRGPEPEGPPELERVEIRRVHVLWHGRTLCDMGADLPRGHAWVGRNEMGLVTCDRCRGADAQLPRPPCDHRHGLIPCPRCGRSV